MKKELSLKRALSITLFFLWFSSGLIPAFGGNTRTQTFELEEGWNAIWLAVEPADLNPSAVFADSPVDIVAAYDGIFSTRQFTTDPNANMLSELGWGVWYAPERPDSFLTKLGAVYGQKGYLVHSTSACTLEIEGAVELSPVQWQPNAYNLTGFCMDPLAPPTFAQFFSASEAHEAHAIYRMTAGIWRRVVDAEAEAMRSGEAFWIYCDGSSGYQGPLRVETEGGNGLVLSGTGDELLIHNDAGFPLAPVVAHMGSDADSVPMAVVVDVIDDAVGGIKPIEIPMVNAAWTTVLPLLEPGASAAVPLAIQMDKMTAPEARTLLCIKTDMGTETWVPVLGLREDLE